MIEYLIPLLITLGDVPITKNFLNLLSSIILIITKTFNIIYSNSSSKSNSTAAIEGEQAIVGFVLLNHSKMWGSYAVLPPVRLGAKVQNIFVVDNRT